MLNWTESVELRGLWWRHGLDDSTASADQSAGSVEEAAARGLLPDAAPTASGQQAEGVPTNDAALVSHPVPSPRPAYGYGTASFDPASGIELDVIGPADPFAPVTTMTLFGRTTGGEDVSLLGSLMSDSSGALSGLAQHRLTADLLVKGMHLATVEDLRFCRACIRLRGLREFLWNPVQDAIGMAATDREGFERVIQLDGAKLTFSLKWDNINAPHHQERERVGSVDVELDEPLDFEQWMNRWVKPLQDLVVFATREPSRTEAFTAIIDVETPAPWWKPEQPPAWENQDIEFLRHQNPLLADDRFGYRRVLFRLGELDDAADTVLREWFALHHRLDPSAGFLFSTLTTQMFLEQRLLSLTSAAEGYHRAKHDRKPLRDARHKDLVAQMLDQCADEDERDVYRSPLDFANAMSQRRRLRWLFDTAAEVLPILAQDVQRRVAELVETRNYFVHQGQRTRNVLDGFELDDALDRLLVVLQANLMLDLGIPSDWAAGALRRSYEGQPVLVSAPAEPHDEPSIGLAQATGLDDGVRRTGQAR